MSEDPKDSTRTPAEDSFRLFVWEKLVKEHEDAVANGDIDAANAILEQMKEMTSDNDEYVQRPKED